MTIEAVSSMRVSRGMGMSLTCTTFSVAGDAVPPVDADGAAEDVFELPAPCLSTVAQPASNATVATAIAIESA
jgi:hypothetical protein